LYERKKGEKKYLDVSQAFFFQKPAVTHYVCNG